MAFLENLFALAEVFEKIHKHDQGNARLSGVLPGFTMLNIFFQMSTRTSLSFKLAALKLGGVVVGTDLADKFSSFGKYEAIEPGFRTMSGYGADLIIIRSKQEGDVARAAQFSRAPVISAGDGKGEHPTQALLDLYTIWQQFGRLDNLAIGLGGDLLRGRTVHSLVRVLSKFEGNTFILASPKELALPEKYKDLLETRGCKFIETEDYRSFIDQADVWYWTRCQSEYEEDEAKREILQEKARSFVVDVPELERMRERAILLHPQPIDERVWEVSKNVVWRGMYPLHERTGHDRKIRIYEQSDNGLWIRMALIFWVIKGHFNSLLT